MKKKLVFTIIILNLFVFVSNAITVKVKLFSESKLILDNSVKFSLINADRSNLLFGFAYLDLEDSTYTFEGINLSDVVMPYTELKLVFDKCNYYFPFDRLFNDCGEINSDCLNVKIEMQKVNNLNENEGIYEYTIYGGYCGGAIWDKDIYYKIK